MSAIQDPNMGLNFGWVLGEDGWNIGMDSNIKKLGALLHLSVIDKDLSSPPASPTAGDRYIVASGATGSWAGQSGRIAVYVSAAWEFYVPTTGWRCWVADESTDYVYAGSTWTVKGEPYDIHITWNGLLDVGVTLARVVFPRKTTFQAGLPTSIAISESAPTSALSCSITKNGTSIGSVNWAAGASVATFTLGSTAVFNAGDTMEIISPSPADATLADISVTLVGAR